MTRSFSLKKMLHKEHSRQGGPKKTARYATFHLRPLITSD